MTTERTDSGVASAAGDRSGPLRCAAVGVGRMGRHHARVYAQLAERGEGIEMAGVYDTDADRCKEVADQHGCRAFGSLEELADAGVNAASIAVPTTFHRAMAEPLLERGVACLIEKPLAQDGEEAEAIRRAADASGACLMVGHIERFNPIMRALRRATSEGLDIVPRFMEVHRVSPMTFRSVDIGVVMDMMIHDLDVVIMLMGGREPDEVQATGVPVITAQEDLCNARLTWRLSDDEGGGVCVANVTASRLALKTERVTRITGENAYIKIDYAKKTGTLIRKLANEIQMEEVRELLQGGTDLTSLKWDELVNVEPLEVDDAEPIVMEVQAFLDSVRSGRRPDIDAEAGLANVRTAERIVEEVRRTLPSRAMPSGRTR